MNILELHNVTFGFIAGMFHYIQKGQLGLIFCIYALLQ